MLETNAKKITAVSMIAGIGMMMMFQNCAQPFQFEGQSAPISQSGEITPDTPAADATFSTKSVSYSSSSAAKPIDMVWVIDNSASMTDKAEAVRKNFQSFMQGLQKGLDIRVALISRAEAVAYKTQVALPSGIGADNIQVNYFVHSYNPMLLVAASTCESKVAADDMFCKMMQANSTYKRAYGSLNSFFRDGAQKVFVFVTDDDSSGGTSSIQIDQYPTIEPKVVSNYLLAENIDYIKAETFQDRMVRKFGESSYKSFGFISGAKALSPCLARESKAYSSVVTASGGEAFNVCEADWSQHFAKLSESIVEYAKTDYAVDSKKLKSIVSVSLNGKLLSSSDYSISSSHVVVAAALLKDVGSYKIDVVYEEWD